MHPSVGGGARSPGGSLRWPSRRVVVIVVVSMSMARDAEYPLASTATERARKALDSGVNYYTKAVEGGEPDGVWHGQGLTTMGLHPGTVVEADVFRSLFGKGEHLRDPHTVVLPKMAARRSAEERFAEKLDKHPAATPEQQRVLWLEAQRAASRSVGNKFADIAFSPTKSNSVFRAACLRAAHEAQRQGGDETAAYFQGVADRRSVALLDSARAIVGMLEDRAGHYRSGSAKTGTIRYLSNNSGMIAALFAHSDSRAGDPQDHVHIDVLNAQWCPDGRWRALDTEALRVWLPAVDAVAKRLMDVRGAREDGLRYYPREDGRGREIVGITQEAVQTFSKRDLAIDALAQQLDDQWSAQHAGAPAPAAIHQRHADEATLLTRPNKSQELLSPEQKAQKWDAEIGGMLAQLARDALGAHAEFDTWDDSTVVERALARLEHTDAKFTYAQVMAAVDAELPANLDIDVDAVVPLLTSLADQVWEAAIRLEAPLADADAVYRRPGSEYRTTAGTLAAEQALLRGATARGWAALTGETAARALGEHARSWTLSDQQREAVMAMLTSDARMHAVNAAAGVGKSYLLGALDAALRGSGRRVLALTSWETAARGLIDGGLDAMNIAHWRQHTPQLSAGDVIVVDEAGVVATRDLVVVADYCARHHIKMVMVGDTEQLDPVGPGGMYPLLAEAAQHSELTEVRRFDHPWEREASLKLRAGDVGAVYDYAAHGRLINGGTRADAETLATRFYVAEKLAGRNPVVIVDTNNQAAKVASLIRQQLVAYGLVAARGVAVSGGNVAGVGDVVEARKVDRSLLRQGNAIFPVNHHTYDVIAAQPDGGLVVTDAQGMTMTLPADYCREHLTLAYGRTTHAVQGATLTNGSVFTIKDTHSHRTDLYPSMSRSTSNNTAILVTQTGGIDGETTQLAESAAAAFADILTREPDDRHGSATAHQAAQAAQAASLRASLGRLIAEVGDKTEGRTTWVLDDLVQAGALAPQRRDAITQAPDALADLEVMLRRAELAGHDPARVLAQAVTSRDFRGVAVDATGPILRDRIYRALHDQLTPHIRAAADLIPECLRDDERLCQLANRADQRLTELGINAAADPDPLLGRYLGELPDDPLGRLEWETRAGWILGTRELLAHRDQQALLGSPPHPRYPDHAAIWTTAHQAAGAPGIVGDFADQSDADVAAAAWRWQHTLDTAPPFVDDILEQVSLDARDAHTRATLAAHAVALAAPDEQTELQEQAQQLAWEAHTWAQQLPGLQSQRAERADWWARTAHIRQEGQRALTEANIRGLNLSAYQPPQLDDIAALRPVTAHDPTKHSDTYTYAYARTNEISDTNHDGLD